MKPLRKHKGFPLVELMIVVIIIGILIAPLFCLAKPSPVEYPDG